LTNDSTKKVEFKVKETTEKTVFKGTYTAKKNGNVNLDNVKIWFTTTPNGVDDLFYCAPATPCASTDTDASDIIFTVKIDGENVATIDNPKYATGATVAKDDADFSPITVEAEKSVSVEVVATIYADHATQTNLEYKIQLA
jgi:hypothetical protein